MNKTYLIEGLKCQGCADTIIEKFGEVAGVQSTTADLEKKTITVTGDDIVTRDGLDKALVGTKYSIVSEM